MSITRDFKVYLNAGVTVAPVIHVNQYDQGEEWVFTLYTDRGIKYTPSSGAICGIKSDGMGIINMADVNEDGQVVVEETQQMTAAPGKAIYSLMIDDDTHYTANFIVMVEQSPLYTAIVSDSDLSLIQEALNSVTPAVIAQEVTDWMDDNITQPTTPVVDASLTVEGAAADAKATGDAIAAVSGGSGLTADIKEALLACFEKVAWVDDDGQDYYDALQSALYPPANLSSITCVYTQSGTVYTTDTLDDLKADLVVTAHYDDSSTATITSYTLSGSLTVGTSTITVSYGGKTCTFTVNVTYKAELPTGYTELEYTARTSRNDYKGFVDTGFQLNGTDDVSIDIGCMLTDTVQYNSGGYFFGCRQTSSNNTVGYGLYVNQAMTDIGTFDGTSCLIEPNGGSSIKDIKYDLVTTKTTTGMTLTDGTNSQTTTDTPRAMASNLYLFGIVHYNDNASSVPINGRIYYLRITEGNTLKVNLIPAKRTSDNAIGFYDVVRETFITNSDLTAGPEV